MTPEQKAYIKKNQIHIFNAIDDYVAKHVENGFLGVDHLKFEWSGHLSLNLVVILKPLVNTPNIFDVSLVSIDIPADN